MPYFFALTAVWVLLSAAVLIFHLKARADTKRRNHPIIVIGMCLIFLLFPFSVAARVPVEIYLYMVPFVAFIAFQWIYTTRFCDACNSTVISKGLLTKPTTCWK